MNSKFQVPTARLGIFDFGIKNITSFTRFNSHANDCVPNALELLGIVTSDEAGELRKSNEPIFTEVIIEKMDNKTPEHIQWDYRWVAGRTLEQMMKALPKGKAVFAMAQPNFSIHKTAPTITGHVFVLSKNSDGKIAMIDPQSPKIYTEDDKEFIDFVGQFTQIGVMVWFDYS